MKIYIHFEDVRDSESLLTIILHCDFNTTVGMLANLINDAAKQYPGFSFPKSFFLATSQDSSTILKSHQHLHSIFAYDCSTRTPCELFAVSPLVKQFSSNVSPSVPTSSSSSSSSSHLSSSSSSPIPASNSSQPTSNNSSSSNNNNNNASSLAFIPAQKPKPPPPSSASSFASKHPLARASASQQAVLSQLIASSGVVPPPKRLSQGLCSVCVSALSFDEDSKFVQCFRCSTVNLPVDRIAAQVECPGCRGKLHIMQATPVTTCAKCAISLIVMECKACTNPFVYLKGSQAIHCSRCKAPQVEQRDLDRTVVHHLINADVNDPPSARFNTDKKIAADALPIALLLQYYVDPKEERQRELDDALRNNLLNRWIDRAVVLLEREEDRAVLASKFGEYLASGRLELHPHGRRLTYKDAFLFANERLRGCTVMLANLDIFFDATLMYLKFPRPEGAPASLFYPLSRYEVEPDGKVIFKESFAPLSQDAWIFTPPLPEGFVEACDFPMGMPGCDNRVVYECQHKGKGFFVTHNPSLKIVIRHLHASNLRNYSRADTIPGKYAYIPPSFSLWPE